ncbi:hypothetical protein ACR5KS_02970 [Leucobacter sp. W1153]|uniref:hypothetical protein n=1 Tax=Leucobacter sp. W1153 TaxID=3439064 RepID=UPI003F37A4E3
MISTIWNPRVRPKIWRAVDDKTTAIRIQSRDAFVAIPNGEARPVIDEMHDAPDPYERAQREKEGIRDLTPEPNNRRRARQG